MSVIQQWGCKWNVPEHILSDLIKMLAGLQGVPENNNTPKSEAAIQNEIRLKMRKKGVLLWRNNSGAVTAVNPDGTTRHIRFGLGNDSVRVNKKTKSADLIGITPVLITEDLLGETIAQFTAIEVKKSDWKFRGTDEENAQLNFLSLVDVMGGTGIFLNNSEV